MIPYPNKVIPNPPGKITTKHIPELIESKTIQFDYHQIKISIPTTSASSDPIGTTTEG